MVTKVRNSGKLKLVFHLKEHVVSDEGIDIVIIPAAWTLLTIEQQKQSCSWLKPLVAATQNDTRVLFFSYELDVNGTSLWNQLLDQSSSLLEVLHDLRRDAQGYSGSIEHYIEQ
ncbi:uncharacterized protein LY89DRAFT_780838 [Mollisia scopiformis]|uniref:Uncharacterized protein n=1 Tax=Mollisia scopiformis TaxID=149040 RepID=A0A194XF97_MOLSC|nr:uncharacterized protein LY89DRAFT_780838 [Mollisia scopiformis]KUJ18843.1 hypothetical protein LY89DRAFT_780838 [Mollisia scopiformis]